MSDGNASQGVATQCIDHLFARMAGNAQAVPPPQQAAPPEPEAANSPPVIRHSNDLKAAVAWLERERKRLDGYTQAQLQRLHKEHQALVSQNYRNEQALIEKIQELGRKEEFLTAQNSELQAQLEARLSAAEQQEQSFRRHVTELDEVEARLAEELDCQRRRLAEQEAVLAERAARLHELESVLAGVQDELMLRVQELEARELRQVGRPTIRHRSP